MKEFQDMLLQKFGKDEFAGTEAFWNEAMLFYETGVEIFNREEEMNSAMGSTTEGGDIQ
jgi:hypothetical protein